jgi:two-component system, OmpR family, response regulator ChvI
VIFDNQDNDCFNHKSRENKNIGSVNYFKSENHNNEHEIIFTNHSRNYCIGIISIIDYTQGIDELKNAEEIRKYYSIFYNTLASIIRYHGGKVIKNVNDVLLFYFPKTVDFSKPSTFQDVLDCGLEIISANPALNSKLSENGLPSIRYKISANYGRVELATSTNSNNVDLFGPAVNICSKINHLALPNQMVIYKDLYDIIEKTSFFKNYIFKKNDKKKIIDKEDGYPYSFYSIQINDSVNLVTEIDDKIDHINQKENPQKQPNSSFNILFIDDDKDILFTFEPFIRTEGYNLTSFSDSKKALDHLSNLDPYYYDLIILDIRMPGFNGFQLYRQIKVLNPDTKMLFLTALDVFIEEIKIVCPDINASDIVRKPVSPDAFLSKIKSALQS